MFFYSYPTLCARMLRRALLSQEDVLTVIACRFYIKEDNHKQRFIPHLLDYCGISLRVNSVKVGFWLSGVVVHLPNDVLPLSSAQGEPICAEVGGV